MFERFTERARRVVVLAQEQARLLDHNYIGTEHLLLGLAGLGEGTAAEALRDVGIDGDSVHEGVVGMIGRGTKTPSGHIPFTPRAKKAFELSLREAVAAGHDHIGTGHLLLGLLATGDGVGVEVLRKLGHDPRSIRDAAIAAIGLPSHPRAVPVPETAPSRPGFAAVANTDAGGVVLAVLAVGGWVAGSEGALRAGSLWAGAAAAVAVLVAAVLGPVRPAVGRVIRPVALIALGAAAVTSLLGAL